MLVLNANFSMSCLQWNISKNIMKKQEEKAREWKSLSVYQSIKYMRKFAEY